MHRDRALIPLRYPRPSVERYLEPGRTLLDLAAFRREAGEILDLPVDVATADMLKDRIRDEVLPGTDDQKCLGISTPI